MIACAEDPYEEVARVAAIADPLVRARLAGAEIVRLKALIGEHARIRAEAVRELRANGLSHAHVAAILGLSRSRAAQIAAYKP